MVHVRRARAGAHGHSRAAGGCPEKSTAAMNAMTAQMAVMGAKPRREQSTAPRDGRGGGAIANQVDDIHDVVVGCKIGGTE